MIQSGPIFAVIYLNKKRITCPTVGFTGFAWSCFLLLAVCWTFPRKAIQGSTGTLVIIPTVYGLQGLP